MASVLYLASPLAAQAPQETAFSTPPAQTSSGESATAAQEKDEQRSPKFAQSVHSANESGWKFVWKNHPSLRTGDDRVRLDFRARFQGDVRNSEADLATDEQSALDIARRRVGVDGEVRGLVDFQVEYELKNQKSWRDVYVNYRQFDTVRIQIGQFKLPFSLDENTSSTNLDFIYRSRIATQLAPGRDPGVMVHGRLFKTVLNYEAGIFRHDGDNARSLSGTRVSGGRTKAARVRFEPFRSPKSALATLQLSLAFTTSTVPEGITGLRGRTALDLRFFKSDFWVNGQRHRIGVEQRWQPGPASIQFEFIRATDERNGQSVENADLSPLIAQGWYVSGTWALTGEKKRKGLDEPDRPLLQGGFGAIELAFRLEKLSFGSNGTVGLPSLSPRADNIARNADIATTIGVNWYFNRWAKIQGNLIREQIEDPSQGPVTDHPSFWSRVVRFQLTI